ncbi:MAG: sulfatase-like hydrolase/transferase [Planctomycetes bacterium]|nr:sulfatase-like hydrolase/transferase [Planctomycetota bacterium]
MDKRFNRRDFLKAAGVSMATAAVMGAGCVEISAKSKTGKLTRSKPNVILIMTDDQGYGDVGVLGNKDIKTPNLDKLHAESVRLTDYHVDPTCSPTRSALMTGRYSSRTGVWHTIAGRSILRADEVTMGDVFSANGYRTAIFGKWHLGDNYPYKPQYRGFDEVLVNGGGGVGQTPDYWGNDYFDDTYFHNGKPQKYDGYCTDIWFDGAMKFIKDRQDKPFFCYMPTNAAHGPYNVAEEYSSLYKNNPNIPNANFAGMITNIDDNMARLMKQLKTSGLEDNTILIFTTDNGTSAGVRFAKNGAQAKGYNAGMRGAKGSEYDGGHRVPFFVRWPNGKITGGVDVNQITAHIDVLPTLIDLCGLKKSRVELDGKSLAPLLVDPDAVWPERTLFVHSQRIEHPEKWRKSAVMTNRWRLVNGKELYDIKADPGQTKDLAAGRADLVEKFRGQYDKWWESISQRFDEYVPIYIGSDHENPTTITCHDWHGARVPWNHGAIRGAAKANGFWAIRVDRGGTYQFELCRWPVELDKPINASIPRGKAIKAKNARLKIADFDQSLPVKAGDKGVVFKADLKTGETTMQTWFIDADGTSRGAYYVYVTRL